MNFIKDAPGAGSMAPQAVGRQSSVPRMPTPPLPPQGWVDRHCNIFQFICMLLDFASRYSTTVVIQQMVSAGNEPQTLCTEST